MTTALLHGCSSTAMFNIKSRFYRLKELEKLIRWNLEAVRLTAAHSLGGVRYVKLRM